MATGLQKAKEEKQLNSCDNPSKQNAPSNKLKR